MNHRHGHLWQCLGPQGQATPTFSGPSESRRVPRAPLHAQHEQINMACVRLGLMASAAACSRAMQMCYVILQQHVLFCSALAAAWRSLHHAAVTCMHRTLPVSSCSCYTVTAAASGSWQALHVRLLSRHGRGGVLLVPWDRSVVAAPATLHHVEPSTAVSSAQATATQKLLTHAHSPKHKHEAVLSCNLTTIQFRPTARAYRVGGSTAAA